jgi:hypothetical protein
MMFGCIAYIAMLRHLVTVSHSIQMLPKTEPISYGEGQVVYQKAKGTASK